MKNKSSIYKIVTVGLLGALVFHADTWPKEPWFAEKLLRWEHMELLPFIEGKPFFDSEMNFIYL